jgi:hypothetical protein
LAQILADKGFRLIAPFSYSASGGERGRGKSEFIDGNYIVNI